MLTERPIDTAILIASPSKERAADVRSLLFRYRFRQMMVCIVSVHGWLRKSEWESESSQACGSHQ